VPLDAGRSGLLDRLAPAAITGARVPTQLAARAWLRDALDVATPQGRVLVIDYATTTVELAERPYDEWVRTYRGHARGVGLLDALGAQDVTCEVAVDQLALVRPPSSDVAQSEWLRSWGIDELVAEGRRVWSERAHAPDLPAIAARSRVGEAEALLDPAGLGAFRVLEWTG
jgi:SAM-dependent MidA family methyltransferase